MARIPLAIIANRVLEEFDRLIETALPAGHSSVEGLNVPEGYIIIGLAERVFSRLGDANGFFPFTLLEKEPALEHLHHRRHARMAERQRQLFSLDGIDQRLVVFAPSPQASPFPELNDGE